MAKHSTQHQHSTSTAPAPAPAPAQPNRSSGKRSRAVPKRMLSLEGQGPARPVPSAGSPLIFERSSSDGSSAGAGHHTRRRLLPFNEYLGAEQASPQAPLLPVPVKKENLFCQPLLCSPAAEIALQPLAWCSESLSYHLYSSLEGFLFTDAGITAVVVLTMDLLCF